MIKDFKSERRIYKSNLRETVSQYIKDTCKSLQDYYFDGVQYMCGEVLEKLGMQSNDKKGIFRNCLGVDNFTMQTPIFLSFDGAPGMTIPVYICIGRYGVAYLSNKAAKKFKDQYNLVDTTHDEIWENREDYVYELNKKELYSFINEQAIPRILKRRNKWVEENFDFVDDFNKPEEVVSITVNGYVKEKDTFIITFEFKTPKSFDGLKEKLNNR